MEDMTHGIECLIAPDLETARIHAGLLDGFNRDRRVVEEKMQQEALDALADFEAGTARALSVFNADWHPGVVGILASRLKDRFHRPTMVFAPDAEPGLIRGSGRSIPGFHLRDALDHLTRHHPGMLVRFGGHAAAAGATIPRERFTEFQESFDRLAQNLLTESDLEQEILYDGEIRGEEITVELAQTLSDLVWGQGYPEPLFGALLTVVEQRVLNERHLKLLVELDGRRFQGIWFNRAERLPEQAFCLFRVTLNEWNNNRQLQLELQHCRV
jgi:single-stranded-DNA-specific exonuclease